MVPNADVDLNPNKNVCGSKTLLAGFEKYCLVFSGWCLCEHGLT